MKKVFADISQTCHVWAQQSQSEGRTSNGSVCFENKTIYSYGRHFPMATFLNDNTVLINSDTYSVGTTNHQSNMRAAISHKKRLYCNTDIITAVVNAWEFDKEFKKHLKLRIAKRTTDFIETAARTASHRRKKTLVESDIQGARCEYERGRELLAFFNIKMPAAVTNLMVALEHDYEGITAKYRARREKELRAAERERVRREKEREQLAATAIEKFKNGVSLDYKELDALRHHKNIYMYIKGDEVITSHGARFPVADAKEALPLIGACKTFSQEYNHGQSHNTAKLGSFRIDKIDTNGNVTAGCHFVEFAEIQRNARLLGIIL